MKITKKQKNLLQNARNRELSELRMLSNCPYFINLTPFRVVCQSVVKCAVNHTQFKTKAQLLNFHQKFCANLPHFEKCPQYKLLTLYYHVAQARKTAQKAEHTLKTLQSTHQN